MRNQISQHNVIQKKTVKYTDRSASYLDLRLPIDSEGLLRMRLYDKRDDFKFPIVNFPFICSSIQAAPAYGVYSRPICICGIIYFKLKGIDVINKITEPSLV
jgi:hypothetical protein